MRQIQRLSTRQVMSTVFRVEQANILEMPEAEFQILVSNIEKDYLFQKLYHIDKIIRRQPFPRTGVSHYYNEINEQQLINRGSIDIESLLQDKADIIPLIQKVGIERFKKYFLYPEPGMKVNEIAQGCGIDPVHVQMINALIDDFCIRSEFYHPSSLTEGIISYSKIAALVKDGDNFIIEFFSPANARGKYDIDYERFRTMCREDAFDKAEIKQVKQLIKQLEIINNRKNIQFLILDNIVKKQSSYLKSGEPESLLPYLQKELAREISVASSSVSRAISHRSIVTQWGEKPLKDFFRREKSIKKESIKRLIETEKELLSDKVISKKMNESGFSISRRTIAALRKELKIPIARLRK